MVQGNVLGGGQHDRSYAWTVKNQCVQLASYIYGFHSHQNLCYIVMCQRSLYTVHAYDHKTGKLDNKMTMSSYLCAIAHPPLWCSNRYRDAPYHKPSQHSSHVCSASQATAGLAISSDRHHTECTTWKLESSKSSSLKVGYKVRAS